MPRPLDLRGAGGIGSGGQRTSAPRVAFCAAIRRAGSGRGRGQAKEHPCSRTPGTESGHWLGVRERR